MNLVSVLLWGFLALNYGRRTPSITLFAHLAYGVILGAFYELAG